MLNPLASPQARSARRDATVVARKHRLVGLTSCVCLIVLFCLVGILLDTEALARALKWETRVAMVLSEEDHERQLARVVFLSQLVALLTHEQRGPERSLAFAARKRERQHHFELALHAHTQRVMRRHAKQLEAMVSRKLEVPLREDVGATRFLRRAGTMTDEHGWRTAAGRRLSAALRTYAMANDRLLARHERGVDLASSHAAVRLQSLRSLLFDTIDMVEASETQAARAALERAARGAKGLGEKDTMKKFGTAQAAKVVRNYRRADLALDAVFEAFFHAADAASVAYRSPDVRAAVADAHDGLAAFSGTHNINGAGLNATIPPPALGVAFEALNRRSDEVLEHGGAAALLDEIHKMLAQYAPTVPKGGAKKSGKGGVDKGGGKVALAAAKAATVTAAKAATTHWGLPQVPSTVDGIGDGLAGGDGATLQAYLQHAMEQVRYLTAGRAAVQSIRQDWHTVLGQGEQAGDSSDSSDMRRVKDIAAAPSRPQLLRRVLEEIVSGRSRPEWLLVQHLPALAIDGHANNEDDDGNDGTGQFHT